MLLFVKTFLLMVLLAGCATAPQHAATDPATLGDWCDHVGTAMCTAMADRCFNGMAGFADGCRDSARPACLAGRSPDSSSGRTWGDLEHCRSTLSSLTCEGLGASVGSGQLSTQCAAR